MTFRFQTGEYPGYPNDLAGYSGLWDPHHCLSGQNPGLSGYPDILTAFNSELGKFLNSSIKKLVGLKQFFIKRRLISNFFKSLTDSILFSVWPRQQCGGMVANRLNRSPTNGSASQKKTRRRVATMAQRRAANIRERRRMFNLNEAFDKLRRKVRNYIKTEASTVNNNILILFCFAGANFRVRKTPVTHRNVAFSDYVHKFHVRTFARPHTGS